MVKQLIFIRSLIFNILFFLLSTLIGILFFPVLISQSLSIKICNIWAKITLYMLNSICGVKIDIKSGIYALYKHLNILIIPVYMSTGEVWDRKGFIKRPGLVKVKFYEPINSGYKKTQFIKLLNSKLN